VSNNKNSDYNDVDKTGEVLSWAIIIIFLFVFWPIGLFLLFGKLGGSAKRGKQKSLNQAPQPVAKKSSKRHPLQKKTGNFISAVMLLISIAMIVGGVISASTVLGQLFGSLNIDWYTLSMSLFFLMGGLITFFSRNIVSRRYSRYKNYYAFINGRGIVALSDLVQAAGTSSRSVLRDLQAMINNSYLEYGAYIDYELECLVLSADAARKLREEIKGEAEFGTFANHMDSQDNVQQTVDLQPNQYSDFVTELRDVSSGIVDETISGKVTRLEELTEKIFRIALEEPDKQPQLKRFVSYYLPTTLKLVRSYATLEKQGIKGENIVTAKKSIGNILDTLTTGYEQQLDKLFGNDVIDIAADIYVLENLLQQDGLTVDKTGFKTMGSGS
jgi:hypothetical protein